MSDALFTKAYEEAHQAATDHIASANIIGEENLREYVRYVESCFDESYGKWERDGSELYIATGGWADNEGVVAAMQENFMFWTTHWKQSQRGGAYWFEGLPERLEAKP